jgi:hypothetical protein
MRKGRIRSRTQNHTSDYWVRIREVQKHVDPDPDPQHWIKETNFYTGPKKL